MQCCTVLSTVVVSLSSSFSLTASTVAIYGVGIGTKVDAPLFDCVVGKVLVDEPSSVGLE